MTEYVPPPLTALPPILTRHFIEHHDDDDEPVCRKPKTLFDLCVIAVRLHDKAKEVPPTLARRYFSEDCCKGDDVEDAYMNDHIECILKKPRDPETLRAACERYGDAYLAELTLHLFPPGTRIEPYTRIGEFTGLFRCHLPVGPPPRQCRRCRRANVTLPEETCCQDCKDEIAWKKRLDYFY